MFVRDKYKLRHKLLKVLIDKHDSVVGYDNMYESKVSAESIAIPLAELAELLGISVEELKQVTPPLFRAKEIKSSDFGEGLSIFAWEDSLTAYDERKYLEIGKKKFNDDIYDVVKWVLPIALIIVAIFTTCTNIQLSKDKSNTQQQIQQIRLELDNLKQLKSIAPLSPKDTVVQPLVK